MSVQMFKELLTGAYNGVMPATMLPPGSIQGGLNVRKVGLGGGWKVRKGCTLHGTTTLGTEDVLSLHQYTHPRNDDYHFLAQYNGSLYDATNDPPATGTTFGSAVASGLSGSVPGFSAMVDELFFYADGSGAPTVWGGTGPFCSGFIAHFDIGGSGADTYVDYTREVTDDRTGTYAVLSNDADDEIYVCSPEIAESITLDLGSTVNAETATITLKSWQSGAWSDRSATDGTLDTGCCLAVDGTISWTRSASDTMSVIGGIMGYWYQITFSAALTDAVEIISCKVAFDATTVSNKWNGVYEYPAAVRFYDQSVGEYIDVTGKVTNESTSQYMANLQAMTTSDFLYIKTIEPAVGFGFGVVPGYAQNAAAKVDQIDAWVGSDWTAVTTGITDETLDGAGDSSFANTGVIWFNAAALTAKRRSFDWDSVPGYWYRISVSAELDSADDDIRIYLMSVATFPKAISAATGVIEFKNRLFMWGDPEYPNRLRYSANGRPDCFSGSDSGYTDAFGDMKPIVCAKKFYNELVVWKEDSVWLLEGYSPVTFGTLRIANTIGLASPQTAAVIETGYPGMKTDEPLSVAIWQDTDGIYVLDGRKPKKVSLPVDQFFNTEYTTAISATYIKTLKAFTDPLRNEYHLLLPTSELVFNYITGEWYPPWERNIDLLCGLALRGTDGRYYVYGGDTNGLVYRLENDTTDKTTGNVDAAISHFVKTRAIAAKQEESTSLRFTLRKIWIEARARAVSTALTVTFFKDMADSGTALATPAAMNVLETSKSLSVPGVDTSQEDCHCFELQFALNTKDLELELWSFLYQVDARGEIVF